MIATSDARNVNALVDSLYLRVLRIAVPSQWLRDQYEFWRSWKRERGDDGELIVKVPGLGSYELKAFSQKPYEFVLSNPEVANLYIWNPDKWESAASSQTGQFLIDFRSKFLQQHGLPGVREFVNNLSNALCCALLLDNHNGWEKISRVDLAVDTAIAHVPTWDDLKRYVTRARDKDGTGALEEWEIDRAREVLVDLQDQQPTQGNKGCGKYEILDSDIETLLRVVNSAVAQHKQERDLYRVLWGKQLKTFYFGRFASSLHAVRYDKRASLKTQGKEYLEEVWEAGGWNGEDNVWRTEFRLKAPFLRQCGLCLENGEENRDLRDFDKFCDAIPQIWQYLTTEWLTLRVPDEFDTNASRWEIDDEWVEVQNAFPSADVIDRKPPFKRPVEEHLSAQMKGVALTLIAKRCEHDTDENATLSVLHELATYFSTDTYTARLVKRRQSLGCDDYTHAALADQLRAEWLREGLGS